PEDCRKENEIIFEKADGSRYWHLANIPDDLANSNRGFPRTLFYLTVSSALSHPYVPHPARALFLDCLIARVPANPSLAKTVLDHFEQALLSQWDTTQIKM